MTTTMPPATILPSALVRHDSPLGRLEIHTEFGAVTRLDIERDGDLPCDGLLETSSDLHDEVRRQLDDYFSGRRRHFDLPLCQNGTAFQEDVWSALGDIPWGRWTSYGDLALQTGRPTGARAVGGAVRANRIALLVPCHRVLGATGRVTGYTPGEGVATKAWLLRHEGIDFIEPTTVDSSEGLSAGVGPAGPDLRSRSVVEHRLRDDYELPRVTLDVDTPTSRPVHEVVDAGE